MRWAVVLLLLVSCSEARPDPPPVAATSPAPPPVTATPPDPSPSMVTFDPTPEMVRLATRLDRGGLPCEPLEPLGVGTQGATLEDFAVCHTERLGNVDIYLTEEPGSWAHILADFPGVLGPDFVIVTPEGDPQPVQDIVGGKVVRPGSSEKG